jgi:hypothetical protein
MSKSAGSWWPDAIQNFTGKFGTSFPGDQPAYTFTGPFLKQAASNPRPTGSGASGIDVTFDVSRAARTGIQTVPAHIYLPVIFYLGRAA